MCTFSYKQRLFPKGPWILIFFSSCCVLVTQETQAKSLEDCCKDGQERGAQKEDCTSLPLISEMNGCRIVQEQCCTATSEDIFCNQGIDVARNQGDCEAQLSGSSCETKTARMCCDCCILGRVLQDQGLKCDSSLLVGHQCKMVSQMCCRDGASKDQNSTISDRSSNIKLAGREDNPELSDRCRGAKCSQRCLGDGTCGCLKGYKLKPDGRNCEDINECLLGSHHCLTGERCINTAGHYRCQREVSCGTGYELTDSNQCVDIDECELGTHNCAPHLKCKNSQGSFRCLPREQCAEGYLQEALGNCIDINECMSLAAPCPPGQMCLNTAGSYICQKNSISCGRGYHLNDDGTRCVDVDECQGVDAPCSGHGCINLLGSFRCECRAGYIFNSITRTCEDNNECRHYPGRLCAHKCENTPGSYRCSCTPGFKLAMDGRNCDDVNECESNPCSQECANVYGSYQCYCRRGYQLSDMDGVKCEDIDECALPTGGHICAYRCHNSPGSFLCSCPSSGYNLAPNGRSCQDIDECVTGTHSCTSTESCFNVQGGFRCLSFDCPPNYRRAGEARCERLSCTQGSECLALPLRITHYHLTFPTNIPVPANIFRMGLSSAVPGDNIELAIVSGDEEGNFSAQKSASGGMIFVQRPITEPRDFLLSVEMRLWRYGTVSTFVARISIFVTHDLSSVLVTLLPL